MMVPIFISYGHYDDQPTPGWVSQFGTMLETRLKQLLDERTFQVWRDTQIPGNASIWDRIEAKLASAQIFVPIVSGRYVTSESCVRELRRYWEECDKRGGVWVDRDVARLFKVVKTPVTTTDFREEVPAEIRSTLVDKLTGYTFFRLSEQGAPIDLDFELDKAKYIEQIANLAFAITKLVKRLQGAEARVQGTVFLGETAPDLAAHREAIHSDLSERGYVVVPGRPIDWNAGTYEGRLADDLARCDLSVHLLGTRRGVVPDEASERGIGAVQLEASLRQETLQRRRIVWVPPDVTQEATNPAHWTFLQALLNGDYGRRVEVVRGSREELTRVILDTMAPGQAVPHPAISAPAASGPAASGSATSGLATSGLAAPDAASHAATLPSAVPPRVFVICHERDVDDVVPIVEALTGAGFGVMTPAFDGDQLARLQVHRAQLAVSDGLLVYHGSAPDAWFKQQYVDLIKASGYRAEGPSVHAVYLGPPANSSKKLLTGCQPRVIKNFGSFDPTLLAAFVDEVRNVRRGHDDRGHADRGNGTQSVSRSAHV